MPAYSSESRPLLQNCTFLPDGYEGTLLYMESLEEIMADKMVSFPVTENHVRYRDIWDLAWLVQKGVQPHYQRVHGKVEECGLTDFRERVERRRDDIEGLVACLGIF